MTNEEKCQILNADESVLVDDSVSRNFKFDTVGKFIEGRYIKVEKVRFSILKPVNYKFHFDTFEGVVTFFISRHVAKRYQELMTPGYYYRITFLGKKEINRGRKMNIYKLSRLVFNDEPVPPSKPVDSKES